MVCGTRTRSQGLHPDYRAGDDATINGPVAQVEAKLRPLQDKGCGAPGDVCN
jgi:hypothetical protein